MKKQYKQYILAIIVCLLIVLGFAGYRWYDDYRYQASLIKEKDPKLTAEERKVFEDRLATDENTLAKTDLNEKERYDWLLDKGYNLYGLGYLSRAKDSFEQAIKLVPDKVTAYTGLFKVQVDMNDNRGARESIKKAVDIKPDSADLWKIYIQLEIDRFNASNDQINGLYVEALNKTRSYIDVLTSYASWLEKSGDLPKAVEYWQQAITINPEGKTIYEQEIDRLNKLIK